MKLRMKILLLALVPVLALGIVMFLVACDRIANGIYDEAYIGMQATALAVRDIFETGNDEPYVMDENGELWRGNLNISQATDITDHIKSNTNMEVTVFWGDTRILTSIVDENGNRQINTQASALVKERVLENGEVYQARNVEILGTEYIVCYIPVYQSGSDEVVGMVFLGTIQSTVSRLINKVRMQFLLIIVCAVVLLAVLVYFMVTRIVNALNRSMRALNDIAEGDLNVVVEPDVLKRKDETGDLGRNVVNLQSKLHDIVMGISDSSNNLDGEVSNIEKVAGDVYQVMQEVNNAAQEMAVSCSTQAQSANEASENVAVMGEMIGENGAELMQLNEASVHMQNVSEQAVQQFVQLNHTVDNVRETIHFLARQTAETDESVARISSAAELITAIASQTKLLSLNASIEAARAGEHGQGFAVVATEIQQLSEQSNSAAGEIQKMIANLNTNSKQSMSRVEEVKEIIERQEGDIHKTSEIFKGVCDGIKESVDGMGRIMKKVENLEDIRVNTVSLVQEAASVSQENSASIEEMMASVENIYNDLGNIMEKTHDLIDLSQQMKDSVNVFSV
ncbi:MAG: methyl-accepting chemotaxis protein [Lachnospiraceae bacterium]|nr:methyl-accepting chemotaxis protein [Lachnospiraceae bacterium]